MATWELFRSLWHLALFIQPMPFQRLSLTCSRRARCLLSPALYLPVPSWYPRASKIDECNTFLYIHKNNYIHSYKVELSRHVKWGKVHLQQFLVFTMFTSNAIKSFVSKLREVNQRIKRLKIHWVQWKQILKNLSKYLYLVNWSKWGLGSILYLYS